MTARSPPTTSAPRLTNCAPRPMPPKASASCAMADIGRALKFTWNADLLKTRARCGSTTATSPAPCTTPRPCSRSTRTTPPPWRCAARLTRARKTTATRSPTLDKAIAADDKDALAFGERGQVYLAKGDDNRALADFNRAISLGAISPAPYRARATIYKQQGRHRQSDRRSRRRDQPRSAAGRPLFRARRAAPRPRATAPGRSPTSTKA